MPRVWNMRDPNCPPDAVYGGRPGPFGNKYSHVPSKFPGTVYVATREESIARHKEDFMNDPELIALVKQQKGEDWKCWCAPLPCHCDIYVIVANEEMN